MPGSLDRAKVRIKPTKNRTRVGARDPEEPTLKQTADEDRHKSSDEDTRCGVDEPVPDNFVLDLPASGAERDPDAELLTTLAHRVEERPVETRGGQDQGDGPKRSEEQRTEATDRGRVLHPRRELGDPRNGQIGLLRPDRFADEPSEGVGRLCRLDRERRLGNGERQSLHRKIDRVVMILIETVVAGLLSDTRDHDPASCVDLPTQRGVRRPEETHRESLRDNSGGRRSLSFRAVPNAP